MSFGSQSTTVNSTTPPATSLRVQTAVAGKARPIGWGQSRVAGNLIYYGSFNAVQQSSQPAGGGGKGGGGSGCFAPETRVATPFGDRRIVDLKPGDGVWSMDPANGARLLGTVTDRVVHATCDSGDQMLRLAFVHGWKARLLRRLPRWLIALIGTVLPAEVLHLTRNHYLWLDGVTKRQAQHWRAGDDLIHASGAAAMITHIAAAPELDHTFNLTVEPHHNFFAEGILAHNGSGGGAGKGNGTYNYFVDVQIGLCEGPIAGVIQLWNNATADSLGNHNFGVFDGDYAQSGWSHLSPSFNYRGLAHVDAAQTPLGTDTSLPNWTFETLFAINSAIAGLPDADPASVVSDFLTNQFYGVGFPAARLGSLATYSSFCRAAGLVISPVLTDQQEGKSFLADMMTGTAAEFVWSGGLLTIVPYADTPIAGNGAMYTPPAAPIYDLTDDDFLPNTGATASSAAITSQDPVQLTQKRQADQYNDVKVEYLDRTNAYNPTIAEAQDDAAITVFGLRPADTKTLHFFCNAAAAITSAQLQLGRQHVINQYTITLGWWAILLDPMDIVTITEPALGLNRQWVRVLEITENDDGTLSIICEEYMQGTATAPLYGLQAGSGFVPNLNSDPGNTNAPVIFEPPSEITATGLEVWLALSGGPNWGGCDVYVSTDDATYKKIDRQIGPSRQGVLSAIFPSGTDPDTSHTCSADLSESFGQLISSTQADADALHTLCYVGGELIAYQQATLTSQYHYDLGATGGAPGYLRRGCYGTTIASHALGTSFARLDNSIFTVPYTKDQIGQTLFVKLPAFNLYAGGLQELSDVAPVEYTIVGPPPPPNVSGFTATNNGNVVVCTWNKVATVGPALKGLDIGYAPIGATDWNNFSLLTEASAGTEMTNAAVPRGTWLIGARWRDIADHLSPAIATVTLTVTDTQPVIYEADEAPGWSGTL